MFNHCQGDRLVTKYTKPFQELQQELIDAESLIDYTFPKKNLSPYQIILFNKRKNILCNQSLAEWLAISQSKESEIIDLLQQTTAFLSAIQQNEFFTPDALQRQQYATLQQKIKTIEKKLRSNITGIFVNGNELVMILDHDIELYLSKTLTNHGAFSVFLNAKLTEVEDLIQDSIITANLKPPNSNI